MYYLDLYGSNDINALSVLPSPTQPFVVGDTIGENSVLNKK